jgi:hypothetical protein
MAEDTEKKDQKSGQAQSQRNPVQTNQGQQSGQSGQPGQQQKKGGQGDYDNKEKDQNRDSERKAS